MKSYTDLEQSKKLAEILPLESADMCWFEGEPFVEAVTGYEEERAESHRQAGMEMYPCWSLAALLELLDYPQLSKDKLGSGKVGWMVSVYPNDCRYDSCWHNNPIDV